jgi:hypothetical protein
MVILIASQRQPYVQRSAKEAVVEARRKRPTGLSIRMCLTGLPVDLEAAASSMLMLC